MKRVGIGLAAVIAALTIAGAGLTYGVRLLARLLRLPVPQGRTEVTRALRIPLRDGMTLAADRHFPQRAGGAPLPTVLIRTPYGRGWRQGIAGAMTDFWARIFAGRGFNVLVVDVRGRYDSEGVFAPFFQERADGLDVLAWLDAQMWHDGRVYLWGVSYLGIVQWQIAGHVPQVRAMMPMLTSARLHDIIYPNGTLDLGLALRWMGVLRELDRCRDHPLRRTPWLLARVEAAAQRGMRAVPLAAADVFAFGAPVDYYKHWQPHTETDDPLWRALDDGVALDQVTAAVHLVGGWQDFFLPGLLNDYAALVAAGHTPRLTIGPWHHATGMVALDPLRWGIADFEADRDGLPPPVSAPVRLYMQGSDGHNAWRTFDHFPPTFDTPYTLYFQPDGTLAEGAAASDSPPAAYRYDPRDPTPMIGGAQFALRGGMSDVRALERRGDVLTFTSAPLPDPLEIIGAVKVSLYASSSRAHTDFFAQLCAVHPDGRVLNVCAGLSRLTPDTVHAGRDRVWQVCIDLGMTAYHFKPGQRIRVQIASGAHPRWSRNPGSGEELFEAVDLQPADQQVYHDRAHPSALILPMIDGGA